MKYLYFLDYEKVIEVVNEALSNEENFEQLDKTPEVMIKEVQNTVKEVVLELEDSGHITGKDRYLMTGVNDNGNMTHSHVFRPVTPYVYPLFKIHKLNQQQIKDRIAPPIRLVHATREGPLYRLEKWVSPSLTKLSRDYCGGEFLLDTPDLLDKVNEFNKSGLATRQGNNLQLFTLDVINLYPSIRPELAMDVLKQTLDKSNENAAKKSAIYSITKVILENAFVCFQGKVYKGKRGIPTGNCISRQIADLVLHWLADLARKADSLESVWILIVLWKRFIDDVMGLWTGTVRQFNLFVKKLNEFAKPLGLQFGDFQVGKSVDYLDVTLSLSEDNTIHYKLYRKETDARRYLQTDSFHPEQVFRSVVFSQMIRVIQRNSLDNTCVEDLAQLKRDIRASGHKKTMMEKLEPKAAQRAIENDLYGQKPTKENQDQLVFSIKYFQEVKELKKLVRSLEPDIKQICGDINVIVALRKSPSIGNRVVRNRKLSTSSSDSNSTDTSSSTASSVLQQPSSQSCGHQRCLTCPYLFPSNERILINGTELFLDQGLTCKDNNVIYVAQCSICSDNNTYFGQTVNPFHIRMNGHRSHFKIDSSLSFEKSALSMHAFLSHKDCFSMNIYKLGIVKKVSPMNLDREEDFFIAKFRTNVFGLNRMVVTR